MYKFCIRLLYEYKFSGYFALNKQIQTCPCEFKSGVEINYDRKLYLSSWDTHFYYWNFSIKCGMDGAEIELIKENS